MHRGGTEFRGLKVSTKPRKLEFNSLCTERKWANLPLSLRRVWIYQRGKQNPYIEEEQTTQWPKETVQKGHCGFPNFPFRQILSVCWLMSFAFSFWKIARCSVILLLPVYIKGVSRIHISKKSRQHNGQKKKGQKDKQRSTKHTHKTKDWVKRTPLNTGVNSGVPEG